MNLEDLTFMTQALQRNGVKAHGITIKGKESKTLSFTAEDIYAGDVRVMCDRHGFDVHLSMDQFLPPYQLRFQLSIGEANERS